MIDQVSFENFKSLKNLTIDLGRLTVLVGPNGCGKSSVLQGIHLLSQTTSDDFSGGNHVHGRFASIFADRLDPRRLAGPERPTTIALKMRDDGGDELAFAVSLGLPLPSHRSHEELAYTLNVGRQGEVYAVSPRPTEPIRRRITVSDDSQDDPQKPITDFGSVAYLGLNASVMTSTSTSDSETPTLDRDGRGLASVLAWMAGAQPETLAKIVDDLARIVPGVRRILTYRERIVEREMEKIDIDGQPIWRPVDRPRMGERFSIQFDVGGIIPGDLLSEGTVLALGLLTKLNEPRRPRLVLLDDIDRGLHVEAQAKLVGVLRGLLALNPELQIIGTTHSPYLLDRFDASEVRVLALDEQRQTHAQALTAHPDFEKWRFGTQTGELWAALGDAWVARAEPTK